MSDGLLSELCDLEKANGETLKRIEALLLRLLQLQRGYTGGGGAGEPSTFGAGGQ